MQVAANIAQRLVFLALNRELKQATFLTTHAPTGIQSSWVRLTSGWRGCRQKRHLLKLCDARYSNEDNLTSFFLFHYRAGLQSMPVEDLKIPNKYVGLSEYILKIVSIQYSLEIRVNIFLIQYF
jgi:hypothetical protein